MSISHLLLIPTLDSPHCEKELLCFSLIGKVKAYLVALCKHRVYLRQTETKVLVWKWHMLQF